MDTIVVPRTAVAYPIRKTAFFSLLAVVFSIPWENMVVLPGIGTLSRILGVLAMGIAVFALLIEKSARTPTVFHGIFALFVWWSALAFLWSADTISAQTYLISLAQIFVFVWLLWEFAETDEHQALLMKAYVLGAYVSAFFTFRAYLTGQETNYLRYAAKGFDPNDLGLILALGVPMAWHAALTTKSRILSLFFGLYLPVATFTVALTSSRGSVVALFIALLFPLWTIASLSLRSKFALALLSPAAVTGLIFFIPGSSWDRIASIPAEISGGTLNARMTIWDYGIRIFADHPFLGIGPGNFDDSIDMYLGSKLSSHNTYLAVLVEQGIIGFLIAGAIVFTLLRFTRQMSTLDRKLWIILLLTWGSGAMSLTWTLRKPTWLLFGLLVSCGAAHLTVRRRPKETATGSVAQSFPEF